MSENESNVGVILTRAQPIHLGHIGIIKQALKENEKVILVIGSANKSGTKRNPFNIDLRLMMVEDMLKKENLSLNRIEILPLVDWSMEDAYTYVKEWGRFFYYNVVNKAGCKEFTFYYNDDIKIVENWFEPEILRRITIKNVVRTDDISSTKVREAILNKDYEYLKYAMGYTPEMEINEDYKLMKYALNNCNNDDFIMN